MSERILGIELGSTRIKSVLIDETGKVLSTGAFQWENHLVDGHWSYTLEEVKLGLQASYKEMAKNYGEALTKLDAIGISGMMHGYLAFDENWHLLVPFRTWRDTTTEQASEILTRELKFNFPQRWSSTHYFQAILNKESSVSKVAHLQTLAGYVHYLLTGKNVLGPNDASGMFPLSNRSYDQEKLERYSEVAGADISKLLPEVLLAGEYAGSLTKNGALFLDPTGVLQEGCPLCPPEGDMGTGMIATNSVLPRTANISAGTAGNITVILERPLKSYYKEIDVVFTPDGHRAAMVHVNNCTSEINEWVSVFDEVLRLFNIDVTKDELFKKLFEKSKESDGEVGKLVSYNYLAGEPLAGTSRGAPMVVRPASGNLNLANFMQAQIYSVLAALALGKDILKKENVQIDRITAHGGFYKTKGIGQIATSAIFDAPVTVMATAGEGGAWGIALLARYLLHKEEDLPSYLEKTFASCERTTLIAGPDDKAKWEKFFENYKAFLPAEVAASKAKFN